MSLDQEEESDDGPPPDPFQALTNVELVAAAIAHRLAPKRIPREGEVRWSFCFPGHRQLFRELNLLRTARVLVNQVLSRSEVFWICLHRETRWAVNVLQLHQRIQRSSYSCPPDQYNLILLQLLEVY
jgi:hypothetical protein